MAIFSYLRSYVAMFSGRSLRQLRLRMPIDSQMYFASDKGYPFCGVDEESDKFLEPLKTFVCRC